MDSQTLKQIEELYHAVAGMPAGDRFEYYRSSSGGANANLRNEVESLLSFEKISDSFIDTSPDDIAAELFSDEQQSPPLVGQTVGHYKITKLLGEGGMGEVYLADDDLLNRKVALKLVWPSLALQADQLQRFKREAQASSALNHPNILTIHEFGTQDGANYIVSEFVDGVTLRKRMSEGRLPLHEAIEIGLQVASALRAAHEAGIVHRDIKPENIMIRRDGIVKLLDFGIAKLMMPIADPAAGGEAQTLFQTAPGLIVGTAYYMSPEQARGIAVDGRTDIWSLGVVIYEMLSGRVPFRGDTQTDVLVEILSKPVPPVGNSSSPIPVDLLHIIDKTLAKDADGRYQTVEELYSDLKEFKSRLDFEVHLGQTARLAGETPDTQADVATKLRVVGQQAATQPYPLVQTTNPGTVSPSTRRFLLPGLITLIVAAGIVGGYLWTSRNAAPPIPPNSPGEVVASPTRTLAYSLTVQSYSDGRYKDPFILSGEMLFRNRDRIRLNVKGMQTGQLYILNQGPNTDNGPKQYNILFPTPTTNNGSASLSPDEEVQIPQKTWFELDNKEGTELVFLVWSENAIPELESAKAFANAVDKGRIRDAALNAAIEVLLQKYPSNKASVDRDDDKKESRISGNTGIVTHTIKLEHH